MQLKKNKTTLSPKHRAAGIIQGKLARNIYQIIKLWNDLGWKGPLKVI